MMRPTPTALTSPERTRLAELERVVARGVQTFVEVGVALTEIRDRRLYRERYPSFEAYLAGAWQLGRSTGYGMIDAARVAANVPLEGHRLSLSHLRVLAPLDVKEQEHFAPVVAEMSVAEARRVIRRWRAQQRREWVDRPSPPLPKGTFRTVVVDPPLAYPADYGDGLAADRYKTMALDELEAIPVADLAAPDSHLYLWIGATRIPDGLRLVSAWGFEFVALLTWAKPSIGLGTWWRYQTEHLVHARRGTLRTRPGFSNLFEARRSRHSAKPDQAYALIAKASPGPYLEMFAREARDGWTVWGDELPAG
jgi:N6-adenosine-specific RNA methylase IME4